MFKKGNIINLLNPTNNTETENNVNQNIVKKFKRKCTNKLKRNDLFEEFYSSVNIKYFLNTIIYYKFLFVILE